MNKHLKTLVVLYGFASIVGQPFAYGKDAAQLDNEANQLESHSANQATKAAAEQNESSTAIDEGKRGSAAEHAKKAAKDQAIANKYADKAHKVKKKAAQKAVKEAY